MRQPPLLRRAALRLLVGAGVLALTACGRKGAPKPPYDVDPCYPRHYPMDEAAKQACAQRELYVREHPPQPPPPPKEKKSRQTTPPPASQTTPAAPSSGAPPRESPTPAEPPAQPQ